MPHGYLVRYGRMRHIGRFAADSDRFERGQRVVVRSCRGTELGEILAPAPWDGDDRPRTRILSIADTGEDSPGPGIDPARLGHFQALIDEGPIPLLLIEAEVLLDPGRVVLHYLGDPEADVAGLRDRFRGRFGLDVVFEAAGGPPAEDEPAEPAGCGTGGCGTGGCGSQAGAGCGSCGVKDLLARRRRPATSA